MGKLPFEIQSFPNQLLTLFREAQASSLPKIHTGRCKGSVKGCYSLLPTNNGAFIFVIDGAFEIQGRLLHLRDALAMWNTEAITFEALSHEDPPNCRGLHWSELLLLPFYSENFTLSL
ncbi:hypothetical protein AAG747_21335 [Rapidithrix thailandica]|uniref:Quercetin 2,3-dioxygenase C-terminal cupin domain-containing protein n=1 Tax=Rapidithrix thailandica TaxID=413964 RepID=A0AAW9SAL9_9BACT